MQLFIQIQSTVENNEDYLRFQYLLNSMLAEDELNECDENSDSVSITLEYELMTLAIKDMRTIASMIHDNFMTNIEVNLRTIF